MEGKKGAGRPMGRSASGESRGLFRLLPVPVTDAVIPRWNERVAKWAAA